MNNHTFEEIHPFMEYPYTTKLSFSLLIEYWKEKAANQDDPEHLVGQIILEKLKDAEILYTPIEDLSVLEPHRKLIRLMLTAAIPSAIEDRKALGIFKPFTPDYFYATEPFKKLFEAGFTDGELRFFTNRDPEVIGRMKILNGCFMILNKYYGTNLEVTMPLVYCNQEEGTGLDRFYKTVLDHNFVHVKNEGNCPNWTKPIFNICCLIWIIWNCGWKNYHPNNSRFTESLALCWWT